MSNQSFRSLPNYKKMHEKTASNKGIAKEFQEAKTLTEARKILFGEKKGSRRSK